MPSCLSLHFSAANDWPGYFGAVLGKLQLCRIGDGVFVEIRTKFAQIVESV
jgi:hypothetical protein